MKGGSAVKQYTWMFNMVYLVTFLQEIILQK